jgi:hypothetical protein
MKDNSCGDISGETQVARLLLQASQGGAEKSSAALLPLVYDEAISRLEQQHRAGEGDFR